ncbi:MAG: hypothetical protein AAGI37_04725 [Planctomycetota bacterium]
MGAAIAEQDKDPFYVGYLPLPAAIKRFILPWLVGNFVLAVGIAAVVALQDREPGDGVWDTSQPIVIKGALRKDPYPVLKTIGQEGISTYILVEQGKTGVQKRVSQMSEGSCTVTGYLIKRDGRKIIELDNSITQPIAKTNGSLYIWSDSEDLGTHTLRGEIVDPKCYLGVMQPGDGKTHKVCATLCIKGGIPPMLLVRDKQGKTAAYLLTDAEGNAFPESHYQYIADPIEVTGRVLRDGDLLVFRADLTSIRRLGVGD